MVNNQILVIDFSTYGDKMNTQKDNWFLKASKSFAILALIVLALGLTLPVNASPAAAAGTCQCLVYFQNATGLPPTGLKDFGAQGYATWLGNYKVKGKLVYNVSYLTADTKNASSLNNTYIIWSASRIGNSAGHIALLKSASYDAKTKNWTFNLQQANAPTLGTKTWSGTDSNCINVTRNSWKTSSLSGLTFFKVSKR